MQVHRSIVELPSFKNAVVTIGTFDGVHSGHQKIIAALKEQAQKTEGETVVVTFHPHPRKIVQPEASLQLINTLDERIELLKKQGIDHIVIVPFTKEFSELSAEQYVEDFLLKTFNPQIIIIGYDHHFGKDRKGNYQLLEQYAAPKKFELVEIPKHVLEEIAISSTKIRNAILSSNVETANHLLGYTFFFEGKVEGDQIGRGLGFPTANLEYTDAEKIHLGHGVYAVEVVINGTFKKGMLSIGNRPTLKRSDEKIEVNIFDFDEQIYGQTLKIIVKKFLRQQEKYNSLEELKAQLARDKEQTIKLLS
jgi:riboflavin kinase / FMN adenylyltransferase